MRRHDEYSSSEASDSCSLDFHRRDISFKSNFPDEGYQSMESSYRFVPKRNRCYIVVLDLNTTL